MEVAASRKSQLESKRRRVDDLCGDLVVKFRFMSAATCAPRNNPSNKMQLNSQLVRDISTRLLPALLPTATA